MLQIKTTRLPTRNEMLSLVAITQGDNRLMHWANEYSWCQDQGTKNPKWHAVMGYDAADGCLEGDPGQRYIFVGFRPVFEIASPNEIPDGTIAPIATLYMGNRPIKIPNNPICVGDIPEYVPGSGLEFLPTVENPDYQIQAIKVGDVLIADRNLVYLISWENLHEQGFC